MAPLAKLPTVALQHAIWSRTAQATCKLTPLNKALAHALYRANYISWFTESGHHAPDASLVEQFAPEELMEMHVAHTENRNKRQLWMGLRYRTQEWKRENGWWEDKKVPVMKTILNKSQRSKNDPIAWSAGELGKLVGGQALGNDMWRQAVADGQALFLKVVEGIDVKQWPPFEVLESREAAERGLGGQMLCRVWPYRPRPAGEDGDTKMDDSANEKEAFAEALSTASKAKSTEAETAS